MVSIWLFVGLFRFGFTIDRIPLSLNKLPNVLSMSWTLSIAHWFDDVLSIERKINQITLSVNKTVSGFEHIKNSRKTYIKKIIEFSF